MSSAPASTTTKASTSKAVVGRISHDAYPPIEQFQTIDGLLKSHAKSLDQKPLICYPAHEVSDFEEHTAADLDRYTNAATRFYVDHGLAAVDGSREKAPVVALLAPSSFEVILTIFALNRLGYAILFLSTRLTADAYARLMGMVDCSMIIYSESFGSTVSDVSQERKGCTSFPMLQRHDWHGKSAPSAVEQTDDDRLRQGKKIAWILHSSGSTGFPKPIFLTNNQCLANFRKSFGMRGFCVSPLFHSGGLMELFRAFYTRSTYYVGNHAFPVTSSNLLEAIKVARPQLVCAVPYVLKLLAEKEDGIRALASAELVLFNGSGCPDDLGDRLVQRGVNLVANYGATETGQIMTSFRPPDDKEWSYMRLWPPVADKVLMDEISLGVYECVGLDGLPSKGPSNSKPPYSESNPPESFRTADLFTRHPDPAKSNFYKYLSRLDDRITLVMGEKVLPLPMEGRIRQEEIVREAVMFGYQQSVPGVLIFRAADKATEMTDEEYLDAVWPAVEAANSRAETFSHIMRDLVIIKSAECDYPKTDKGTFIRAQVYQQFDSDILGAYAKLNETGQEVEKLKLTTEELEDWLLKSFREFLRVPLPDAQSDIFSAGVDSLQTTRIWRLIRSKLDLGSGGNELSTNVVFERGNVQSLARYLYRLRTGEVAADVEDEVNVMQDLIAKYSRFTTHIPASLEHARASEEVVIVTGATGNLGAFIVAEMLKRPQVSEVWALVRASGQAAAGARVMQSIASRGITLTDVESSKLYAVPSDLGQPDLGLRESDLQHLLSNLTCVVHSAWAVNFNLGVRSFESQHIGGTHNLINVCLRTRTPTPAKFFFCSSVSTASGTPKPATIQETMVSDLRHTMNTGYGRSKLVAEHITRNAMQDTGMHARVLRIGQLSGDRHSAYWNDTEAIALMIRSALTTDALPALDERPSWLPVDVCAQAVAELSMARTLSSQDPDLVYHLVNPTTFSWKDDLLPALKSVASLPPFDVVSSQEWLRRLANSEQDPVKNPSIKLIDFWRGKYGNASAEPPATDAEPAGLTFESKRSVVDAPSLGYVRDPVSDGLVQRYVEVWLRMWKTQADA